MLIKLGDVFLKQKLMRRVIAGLLPILVFSIYLFGFRVLTLLALVTAAGLICEYLMMRLINGSKAKISEAVLVTCLLYTLTLPPRTPYWVALIGIIFGVVFGKGMFGGFGRNIFNPALVGRCLIYISFPAHLTIAWTNPFSGFPAGFARFTADADAFTAATPISELGTSAQPGYLQLLLGNTGGSLGETSALLILAVAAWLIVSKTASWKIMLSCFISFTFLAAILFLTEVIEPDPLYTVLSGGFVFATVFMATDPISAPNRDDAKVVYGVAIGLLALVIRSFSLFNEGIMFAILIANTFAPLFDRQLKVLADKRAERKKVSA